MGKIAFLFAGQGAQYKGMGKSLYELGGKPKIFFDLVAKLKDNIKELCFFGDDEQLADTANTQSCVFAVDLAAGYALLDKGITPDGVAGFSLGEMAALTFAHCFSDEEGFSLVCKRGQLMAGDAQENPSEMAAVLKLDNETVVQICNEFDAMYPANYNCAGQLVVAGASGEMGRFCDVVKEHRGLAKKLAVSGGFHSPFMARASADFEKILKDNEINPPKIAVYSNLTADVYPFEKDKIVDILSKQICNAVLWEKSIINMINDGFDTFIEVGAGKTLSGLVKRIAKAQSATVRVLSVEDEDSLNKTVEEINRPHVRE